MTIKKIDGTTASAVVTLQTYFGRKEEQTLQQFMEETKKLTPEDKDELTQLAAAALGWTVEE